MEHSNNPSTGGQSQGKWEHREDNTGGQGEDTYTTQHLGQSGYDEYGTRSVGGQTGTGPGIDSQPDWFSTTGQHGGSERDTTSQTAGYVDPTTRSTAGGGGRLPEDDDEYSGAVGAGSGPPGKPSMTSRVKGAAEKITGKITGDPGKQARGREREEGTF